MAHMEKVIAARLATLTICLPPAFDTLTESSEPSEPAESAYHARHA